MAHPGPPSSTRTRRIAELGPKLVHLWRKEIWRNAHLKDTSPRGWGYAALRVISITWTVFMESKVPARAAALTFSSLLGMGPLVAIAVLVGGFVLGNNSDPNLVANKLGEILVEVAPQLRDLEELNVKAAQEDAAKLEAAAAQLRSVEQPDPLNAALTKAEAARLEALAAQLTKKVEMQNDPVAAATAGKATGAVVAPGVVSMIEDMIKGARSGSAGAFGVFSFILIVLLLFKSVEDAFNDIWGVRLGRSLLMRIVFYWTILTLGAVLFFTAVTLFGASTFINVFKDPIERLPGGHELFAMLRWLLPVFSATLLVGMLTLVYRVIPNTRVFWRAAFVGALVVTGLLLLNNFVAFFYVRRVMLTRSLYGSLALPIVLMLGLYIFWLYVLIGGVISYAVQNVHFRNSQAAWSQLTESMRERISLVVLLTIGRRFQACLPPVTASQLSELLKVPTQILNECLNRLVVMQLIATLRSTAEADANEHRYQPARPLSRITLYDFKTLDDNMGEDPIGTSLERIDPLLGQYDAALAALGEHKFFKKTLEELFAENPFDESRPPFALGERHAPK